MKDVDLNARKDARYVSEIGSSAYAYPSELVDNAGYLRRCRFELSASPEQLAEETRMKTRRWCSPEENTATMVRTLVEDLLERDPELAAQIDVVVVASGTTMTLAHPSDSKNRAF